MVSCVVCYGPIGEKGAWKVAGPGPERLAHFDCHRLAFDRPPAQRLCPVCSLTLDLPHPTPTVRVGIRGIRYHTICRMLRAPSARAGMMVN